MAWSTPLTAVTNAVLTAAQWNASVRDNLLETAAAKATTASRHFVATGANTLAEREFLFQAIDTSQTTTSTSYVDLATPGPTVTLTTGPKALVLINARVSNSGTGASVASYGISGSTTSSPANSLSIWHSSVAAAVSRQGVADLRGVTSGSNTFYMQYVVSSGTGTFDYRRIQVMAL